MCKASENTQAPQMCFKVVEISVFRLAAVFQLCSSHIKLGKFDVVSAIFAKLEQDT